MSSKLIDVQEAGKLDIRAIEHPIDHDAMIGFIDQILINDKGWWICDLKTKAMVPSKLAQMLERDVQLNLYAYFHEKIAKELDIKVPFRGCMMRVVTKPRLNKTKMQTVSELKEKVRVIDYFILKENMHILETWDRHLHTWTRSMDMREKKIIPPKNLSNCIHPTFGSPCQFFSKCHGVEFSDYEGVLVKEY